MESDYDLAMAAISSGNIAALEEISRVLDDFPDGKDHFVSRHWITNAVDLGTLETIDWMLEKGVELRFKDAEGYSILHSAIDREKPDKKAVLERLIKAGADVNAHGMNDWTPAHMAAARNDEELLEVLIRRGADLGIRTRIDDCATPLEEARMLKCKAEVIQLLEEPGQVKHH